MCMQYTVYIKYLYALYINIVLYSGMYIVNHIRHGYANSMYNVQCTLYNVLGLYYIKR